MTETSILLSVKNLSRIYELGENKLYALNNVNLEIYDGEFLVILGPSGSGKSTLLNMLGGTDRPTSGQIIFENQDLATASDRALTLYRRNKIGFIFQFYNLIPTLTALENVDVVTAIANQPLDPMQALTMVELTELADHFPAQMSGGQQQRVAIARALASNPKILLCDEPTGALDSKTGKVILGVLIDVCRRLKKTVIVITHNQDIAKIANRVIKIKDGKIESMQTQQPASLDEILW